MSPVCKDVSYIYNLNDEEKTCGFCKRNRFDENRKSVQTIKVLSIGDIISELSTNETTRNE
jgi:hypothetical protein